MEGLKCGAVQLHQLTGAALGSSRLQKMPQNSDTAAAASHPSTDTVQDTAGTW